MKTVRFAKHYSKLDDSSFTTIRDHEKDILNENVRITYSASGFQPTCVEIKVGEKKCRFECEGVKKEFIAKCIKIEKTKIIKMDFDLLKKDTDTKSIYQGFNELKKYYPDLTMESYVYVYYFEKERIDNE